MHLNIISSKYSKDKNITLMTRCSSHVGLEQFVFLLRFLIINTRQ